MDFRVYTIVEIPVLDRKYELLIPIDRRIHDVIEVLSKEIPELKTNYYNRNTPRLYNKSTGIVYDMNAIIENSDIKTGTRLVLI